MDEELREGGDHNDQVPEPCEHQAENRVVQVRVQRVLGFLQVGGVVRLEQDHEEVGDYPYEAVDVGLDRVFNKEAGDEGGLHREAELDDESEDDHRSLQEGLGVLWLLNYLRRDFPHQ